MKNTNTLWPLNLFRLLVIYFKICILQPEIDRRDDCPARGERLINFASFVFVFFLPAIPDHHISFPFTHYLLLSFQQRITTNAFQSRTSSPITHYTLLITVSSTLHVILYAIRYTIYNIRYFDLR
jgi:hypothetical protein